MDKCEWSIWLSVAHHSTLTRLWLGPTIQKESFKRKGIDSRFDFIGPYYYTCYLFGKLFFSTLNLNIKSAYTIKSGQDCVTKYMIRVFSDPTPSSILHSRQRDPTKQEENNWSSIISVCLFVYMCARHSYFMERKTRICI